MKASSSTINFGLIGAGAISWSAAEAIKKHANGKVLAISDPNAERAREVAGHIKIEKVYADAKELFANPDINAVYIATPNKFHAPLAKQALTAGKHVILEKPFAMNYPEAKQVTDLAAKKKLAFTVGMNQRFNADSQRVRQLVEKKFFGEIYHAKAYWRRRTGIPKLGTWFGNKELAGAGSLYDIGVHMLDLCLYVTGNFEPVSVSGQTYTKFGNRGLGEGGWGNSEKSNIKFDVDDFASAFIRFANGTTVTLDTSWACHQADANRDNVEIFGTEAGASVRPAKLYRYGKGEFSKYEVLDLDKTPVALAHQCRFHNFINHLLGKEKLVVTPTQALTVQKILDAIAKSSKTGKEVRLA
ncbi:MAG: Gfo/Idh/MocA family oxidoreductase [Verrucomicrobiales bacterium]|jgi:predicted dehydrogenase|nr:Gfo/Idh/MocA family oxidoreductase [Verrucomicrobiales bacterium]